MSRTHRVAVCLILGIVALPAVGARPPAPGDSAGDPLPPGAVARLGTTRLWHGATLGAVALSPDGKVVASGGNTLRARVKEQDGWEYPGDRTVRLWDTATGKELRHFAAPADNVLSLRFSPDGKALAGLCSGLVCVWDPYSGRELRRFAVHEDSHGAVEFSADGKTLKLTDDTGFVDTWDLAGGRHRHWEAPVPQDDSGACLGAGLSPDGKTVVWCIHRQAEPQAKEDSKEAADLLRACDAATGRKLYEVPLADAQRGQLAFSPDGKLLAHALWCKLQLREAPSGKLLRQADVDDGVCALAFSPDGKVLGGIGGATVPLWDAATLKPLQQLRLRRGPPDVLYQSWAPCLSVAGDGGTVAAAGVTGVQLWDVKTGLPRPRWPGHRATVEALAFSADGRRLFSAGDALCTWGTADWREQSRLPMDYLDGHDVVGVSADRGLFVTRDGDGALTLHDTAAGKELRLLGQAQEDHPPTLAIGAVFTPDARRVVGLRRRAGRWDAQVYEVATGKTLHRLELKKEAPNAAAEKQLLEQGNRPPVVCSADGKVLAWYDLKETVGVLDLDAGKTLREFALPPCEPENARVSPLLALAPDGRYLACVRDGEDPAPRGKGDDYAVHVYEVATGREVMRLEPRQEDGQPAPVACLRFAPDGRILALGRYDEDAVRLWEVASGQERRTLIGHSSAVRCLAFAPDGKQLASGSSDTTVLIWDLAGSPDAAPGPQELEALWADLAGDGKRADRAIRTLGRHPAQAVPFLAERLRPAAAADAGEVAQRIADLSDRRFAVRQRAAAELERLHVLAEAALREALGRVSEPDARRSLERLLQKLQGPGLSGAGLREVRGVEVLERAATPEARAALTVLAGGAPAARLTVEARVALRRLRGA